MNNFIVYASFHILNVISNVCGDFSSAVEFSSNPALHTSFYLYTSLKFEDAQVLPLYNTAVLRSSIFNRRLQTRILIHDFNGNHHDESNRYLLAAYLLRRYLNLIVVDWSAGVSLEVQHYALAVTNTFLVGKVIGNFLDFLSSSLNYPLNNVYLIGYGLGAHAAGFAGKFIRGGTIGAIFGLDPVGPSFQVNSTESRLAKTDAEYVEVIHTSTFVYGLLTPIGHADFYANGGGVQPGCSVRVASCAHQRSYRIFAESINTRDGFKGRRCENLREATGVRRCLGDGAVYYVGGEPAFGNREGLFAFRTGASDPYARL